MFRDRLYLNDGKGNFSSSDGLSPEIGMNTSEILAHDYDGDGDQDLFIFSRSVPGHYAFSPVHFLYQNDGKGRFTEVSEKQFNLRLDPSRDEDDRGAVDPPAPGPSPVQGASGREIRGRIDEALDALPDAYREVLVLREIEGLSYDEISRALRVSRGTVESRIFRARERLRARLGRLAAEAE